MKLLQNLEDGFDIIFYFINFVNCEALGVAFDKTQIINFSRILQNLKISNNFIS